MPKIQNLPDAGADRFWHARHQPSSVKFPMLLELREKTISNGPARESFSKLIAKQPVIADEKAIIEAAEEILIRAGRVDEFTGVIEAAP